MTKGWAIKNPDGSIMCKTFYLVDNQLIDRKLDAWEKLFSGELGYDPPKHYCLIPEVIKGREVLGYSCVKVRLLEGWEES